MKRLLILRDFIEDNRISMETYADQTALSMQKFFSGKVEIDQFVPKLTPFLNTVKRMRFARYVLYPLQIRNKKADIYHIIDHGYAHLTTMLDPSKVVVTVHDVIPYLRWKGKIEGVSREKIPLLLIHSLNSLKNVKHIVSVSENTKQDLVTWFNIKPENITVIHNGIDPIFKPLEQSIRDSLRLKWFGENHQTMKVLISGSQFYKNNTTALMAIKDLVLQGNNNIQIVKIGNTPIEWDILVKDLALEQFVIKLPRLTREEVAEIYNVVDVLLFPSLYEGFGWPPLEAMACGLPVVASNRASLPEIIGDAGVMLDAFDQKGFAQAIQKVLTDKLYRDSLISKGFTQVKKFSMQENINKLAYLYKTLIDNE